MAPGWYCGVGRHCSFLTLALTSAPEVGSSGDLTPRQVGTLPPLRDLRAAQFPPVFQEPEAE